MRYLDHYEECGMKFEVNRQPASTVKLTEEQAKKIEYLGKMAWEKKHAASLIVNLYNRNIVGANMYDLVSYTQGEPDNDLMSAILLLIQICARCEAHEIYGNDYVRGLIDLWKFSADNNEN